MKENELQSTFKMWGTEHFPAVRELPRLDGVRFSIIKRYEPGRDGYRFLHGLALAFHDGRLYASWGHNKGAENTVTEEARGSVSDDDGKTWSEPFTIDADRNNTIGISHGVFLSHQDSLWTFHGAYAGVMAGVHTRAYHLVKGSLTWRPLGVVVEGGFWPMQEPIPMEDGNFIMSGIAVGGENQAAVAISHGTDFSTWDLVIIPKNVHVKMWGESTVIVHGSTVMNVARPESPTSVALAAWSSDFGRTWTPSTPSNLPISNSKPYGGLLSNGQRYIIGNMASDIGTSRHPLTIAVSKPGDVTFSKVFVIRHALFPEGPGESHERAALSYPYAIEHDGHLYVGYSNNGGNAGRTGNGRELWNNNSAELAVIPLSSIT